MYLILNIMNSSIHWNLRIVINLIVYACSLGMFVTLIKLQQSNSVQFKGRTYTC